MKPDDYEAKTSETDIAIPEGYEASEEYVVSTEPQRSTSSHEEELTEEPKAEQSEEPPAVPEPEVDILIHFALVLMMKHVVLSKIICRFVFLHIL